MFRKCLKYDLKALRKIWLIAAAVMLVISLLGGLGSFLYINGIKGICRCCRAFSTIGRINTCYAKHTHLSLCFRV